MAAVTCQHGRTPDGCEDCAYLEAVKAKRIQPRTDLASRGANLAPVLAPTNDEETKTQLPKTKMVRRQKG